MKSKDEELIDKAMSALEAMADIWGAEIDLDALSACLASKPDETRKESIKAIVHQSFMEGAYQCFCDAKDGKIPSLRRVD